MKLVIFFGFTKTVSCLVIGTAQQIDTKLMRSFEKFGQNILVKFYSIKGGFCHFMAPDSCFKNSVK